MTVFETLQTAVSAKQDAPASPGSPSTPASARSLGETGSPRGDTWRSVFNPGRNYNMKGQYFDNVKDKQSLSVWEQHIKSQEAKEKLAPTHSEELVSPEELQAMFSSDRIAKVMEHHKGRKVNVNEFVSQLRSTK